MKKIFSLLLILLLLVSCNKNDISNNYSDTPLLNPIEYDTNIELSNLNYESEINDYASFAKMLDYTIFNSSADTYKKYSSFNIPNSLKEKFSVSKEELKKSILDIAYSGSLTHNFLTNYSYEMNSNTIDLQLGFTNDFATKTFNENLNIKSYTYDYYLKKDKIVHYYSLKNLPLYKSNKGYLLCVNSEQLYFCLEEGYRPYVKEGSVAYKCLNELINIINQTIDFSMNDYQKYEAIFNYVINNISYDDYTNLNKEAQLKTNTSFFLEGALFKKLAVCDGLVKTLVSLGRLIGLEIYHCGSHINYQNGHAYVYVKIDDKYYLSCPTNSTKSYYNKNMKFENYHTQNYFLTNYYTNQSSWKYKGLSYPNIGELVKLSESINVWTNKKYEINGITYTQNPKTVEEAFELLDKVCKEAYQNKINIDIELLANDDILNETYSLIKKEYNDVIKLYASNFNGVSLAIFQFNGGNV